MNKKFISTILAFAMLMSIIPSAFAYTFNDGILTSGTTEETMPTLSLVCLKEKVESYYDSDEDTTYNVAYAATNESSEYIVVDPTDLSANDKFIVAVKAVNFNKFTYDEQGLYQWSTAITYDPTYIKYEPTYYDGGQYDYFGWDLAGESEVERRLKADNTYYLTSTSKNPYTITTVSDSTTKSDADCGDNMTKSVVMAIGKKATTNASLTVLADEQYLAFVEFKVIDTPSDGATVFGISASSNDTSLQFGTNGEYSYTYSSAVEGNKLQEYLAFDTSGVDIFPAAVTYTSLTATGALATQYDGRALNTTNLTFMATPDEGDAVTVDADDITFYYADANDITDATSASLNALGNTISSSTHNGKYLYAVYGGCIALVGQMTVTTDTISAVSSVAGLDSAFTGDTNYTGTTVANVLGDAALVDVTWASGTTTSNVTYADLATNGLGLFTASGDTLSSVDASSATIAEGTNTYYIAPTGSTTTSGLTAGTYTTFTITGTTASITALTISGSIASVVYGNAFNWSNVSVTATTAAGTDTYTGWEDIAAAGIELYYTDGSTYTGKFTNSTATLVPCTTYVYAKAGEVTSGQITATVNPREIELGSTYPTTITTKEYDATTAATISGEAPTVSNAVGSDDVSVSATATFDSATVGTDKAVTIEYTLAGDAKAYYTLPASSANLPTTTTGTITQKELSLPTDFKVPSVTKGATGDDLSGTGSVTLTTDEGVPEAETNTITLSYNYTYENSSDDTPSVSLTNLTLSDTTNYKLAATTASTTGSTASISKIETTDKLVTSSITYGDTYASLADETTDAVITLTYSNNDTKSLTMAEAIAAGYVKLGETAVDSADTVIPVDGGSLVFTDGTVSSSAVTLSVSPKTITLDLSSVTASDTITKTYDSTTALPSGITLSGLAVSSDTALVGDDTLDESAVTGITYVYSSKNVGAAVAIKASGTPTTSDETFNKKYTLALPTDASTTVTGAITAKEITVNTIEVDSIAAGAEDLTGSGTLLLSTENSGIYDGDTVSLKYAYKYSTSDPDAETVTVEITSTELSGDDAGNYTLSATPAATGSVSAKQLTSIDDFELNAVYSSNGTVDISNAVISVTYADGGTETYETLADAISAGYTVTVTDEKGDEVTLTDGAFAVTAGTTYTVTVSKDGVSIDANDGTTTAETKTETATVKVPVTPAEPTLTVSQSTNAITASAPVDTNGDDIDVSAVEYLVVKDGEDIPADAEWTTFTDASAITFTEDANGDALEQGGKYTVYVRVAATDDSIASSEVSADVTTYAHKVEILRTNSTTVIATAYVDDVTVSSYSDFASATGIKVSSSYTKTLYSDSTGSTKVEYDYTIDDDVTLYMKRSSSSGGGGGGSSSSGVTIKFDDSTISGTVGDTHQITATVTGSTSTPTWTSSDESVATVDSNGNITMVGVGTATITATVGTTTKTATVTVTEEDAATPEPTEEPEDTTPLISTDYAKAYANGYEDGSFRPDAYLTRAELASMIARLINGGDIADGAYYASFPDVDADAWYSKYIGYLEGFGILTGYEDGNFLPGDLVTRSEMCAVIARAQKFTSVSYSGEYADVTYEDWARDYIATLAANGIVEGYDGNEFQPYGLLTRAEAVTIINRLLTSTDVEDKVSFNDISGHWAENAIILAASERLISSEMIDNKEEEVVEEEVVEEVLEDTTDEETTEEAADEESEESDEEAADESADEESADDESADDE